MNPLDYPCAFISPDAGRHHFIYFFLAFSRAGNNVRIQLTPVSTAFNSPELNLFRAPESLPILNPSNFVPKNGFPVVKGLILSALFPKT